MKHLSDEETLQRAAQGLPNEYSRRVFLNLAAAAGASISVGGLAACGSDSGTTAGDATKSGDGSASSKHGDLVNQVPTTAVTFFLSWTNQGVTPAASELNLPLKTDLSNYEPTTELSQVQQVAAASGKMITGVQSSDAVVPNIAKYCQANEIYYTNSFQNPTWFTAPDVGTYYLGYQQPRNAPQSYIAAKTLFEAVGGEGEVIHLAGAPVALDTQRTLGVKQAAEEFPGITLVGGLHTQWSAASGRSVLLNLLPKYPNAKGVICQNDSIALGVLGVIKANPKLSHLKVAAGGDGIPEILPALESGENLVAVTAIVHTFLAGWTVVRLFDALNGYKRTLAESLHWTGGVLLTPENAADYKKKIFGARSPFEWQRMSRTLHPKDWDPQFDIQPVHPKDMWVGLPTTGLPLNSAWSGSQVGSDIAAAQKEYGAHYKTGPFHGVKTY